MTENTLVESTLDRYEPQTRELELDPYPTYRRYRETDPVHWGHSALAGYRGAWYLFGHDDAVATLRDPRLGKQRRPVEFGPNATSSSAAPKVPAAARSFFSTARLWLVHRDPPDHQRLRAAMGQAFTPRSLEKMRPRIEAIAVDLIDAVKERGEMDFISEFAFPLPVIVIAEMLGLPSGDEALFSAWSRKLQVVDVNTSERTWQEASAAIEEAKSYLRDFVAHRRKHPGDGLADRLIHLRDRDGDGAMSEEELIANILFLFVAGAGFETTTGLIGNGMLCLLQHPEAMAKLTADRRLMRSAVDEMLRFESPVQMTNRIAFEALEIGGRHIRDGDSVIVMLAAANRDSAVFEDADSFRLDRGRNRHHAFGIGIHHCLGGPLAILEGEVAFDVLLRRLPRMVSTGTPQWSGNVSLRVLRSLPVAF